MYWRKAFSKSIGAFAQCMSFIQLLSSSLPSYKLYLLIVVLHHIFQVVTAPMSVITAIAVEAYKKYILVSLIHNGQVCIICWYIHVPVKFYSTMKDRGSYVINVTSQTTTGTTVWETWFWLIYIIWRC